MGKFYRDKKGQAIHKARCNIKTPKSIGNIGSLTPGKRLPTLSPAAQRLASSKLGMRIGTDKSLTGAYNTPIHSRRHSSDKTPTSTTPRSGSTPVQSSLHSTLSSSVKTRCDTPKHSRKLNAPNDSDDQS